LATALNLPPNTSDTGRAWAQGLPKTGR
jgi:hypothetical protein